MCTISVFIFETTCCFHLQEMNMRISNMSKIARTTTTLITHPYEITLQIFVRLQTTFFILQDRWNVAILFVHLVSRRILLCSQWHWEDGYWATDDSTDSVAYAGNQCSITVMHDLQEVLFASYYYPSHKHRATLAQSVDYFPLSSINMIVRNERSRTGSLNP
jgi:hypothetical protein